MSLLTDALKGLTGPVADYLKERANNRSRERIRKMELEDALHQRKLNLILEGLHADAAWEIEQIRNSGWKDEYVLIVLSAPYIGCWFPVVQDYVLKGFEVLDRTPDYYKWLVLMVFAATYGIRLWRRQITDTP